MNSKLSDSLFIWFDFVCNTHLILYFQSAPLMKYFPIIYSHLSPPLTHSILFAETKLSAETVS